LNLVDAFLIIIPAIVTIFLALRVKKSVGPLKILTVLLALFLVIHGLNHFLGFYGTQYGNAFALFFNAVLVQPLSWGVLVAFGVYYLKRAG
jgi:hypothetical protein